MPGATYETFELSPGTTNLGVILTIVTRLDMFKPGSDCFSGTQASRSLGGMWWAVRVTAGERYKPTWIEPVPPWRNTVTHMTKRYMPDKLVGVKGRHGLAWVATLCRGYLGPSHVY